MKVNEHEKMKVVELLSVENAIAVVVQLLVKVTVLEQVKESSNDAVQSPVMVTVLEQVEESLNDDDAENDVDQLMMEEFLIVDDDVSEIHLLVQVIVLE